MGYPKELDEYMDCDLLDELARRDRLQRLGRCDYCGRSGLDDPCIRPLRHAVARGYAEWLKTDNQRPKAAAEAEL